MMNSFSFMERVALSTFNLLSQYKAMVYDDGKVFYVWQRGNRIIVALDPDAIRLDRVNDNFAHALSTRLQGRRVVRTNSRGLFLQVALDAPELPPLLEASTPLDLSQQPTPWHLPMGMTREGPLWIPMLSGISFLIAGATGSGKTVLAHGWIQALLHGGKTLVYAWDGKDSVEFARYKERANFYLMEQPTDLDALQLMLDQRKHQLLSSGSPNLNDYNEMHPDAPIPPVAVFVDEAADLPDTAKTLLQRMVSIYRFVGFCPIVATNQPRQAEMFPKENLRTRIALKVPHYSNSTTILGFKGAEALPDIPGRGLIEWRSKVSEFQAFRVEIPGVPESVRQELMQRVATETPKSVVNSQPSASSEIVEMAESIRSQWTAELSKSKVSQLLGKPYAGSSWVRKVEQVIEYLSSTTTTTTTASNDTSEAQNGQGE